MRNFWKIPGLVPARRDKFRFQIGFVLHKRAWICGNLGGIGGLGG